MSQPLNDSDMSATMIGNTIRRSLGILQDDADKETAWAGLYEALGFSPPSSLNAGSFKSETPWQKDPGLSVELSQLLRSAREAHESRWEYEAVARLLEIEAALATDESQVQLTRELAHVRGDILLDDAGSIAAYRRVLVLVPNDAAALEAIERSKATHSKWQDLVSRYLAEADGARDASFRSALLVSAVEVALRFGRPSVFAKATSRDGATSSARDAKGKKGRGASKGNHASHRGGDRQLHTFLNNVVTRIGEAASLDPQNKRAIRLFERVLREQERWEDLAKALSEFAETTQNKEEKLAVLVRLLRILRRKLGADERAVATCKRILELSPMHAEASRVLVDIFTERGMWEHLVSFYDGQLHGGGAGGDQAVDEIGIFFQIAMVHWRMRGKPEDAEPYFERLRKLAPFHLGMLGFFREWCRKNNDLARLITILTEAECAMPQSTTEGATTEGASAERAQITAEIAELARNDASAQQAIEHWRAQLRANPRDDNARSGLMRLYRQIGAFTELADLLRSILEHAPPGDAAVRLPLLRELSTIYRDVLKSDSALVTILTQIVAFDARDVGAMRELARVYEALGRFRDLLTMQVRLTELESDRSVKAELYRAIARRWLNPFNNVQNAIEAYEKLRELKAGDVEAHKKLKELYTKRRSSRQLYELYEAEAREATGSQRRALYNEMAKMAAERLDRTADSVRLYKTILAEDPDDAAALDALEKQAERDRDFATVAEALEKRAALLTEPGALLAVLQKLGSVYTDRLEDHAGALRTWRRVLDLSPGHPKALRILRDSYLAMDDYNGLTELYAQSNDWDGLVEVLLAAADRANNPEIRIHLSYRAAAVLEEKLHTPARAQRAYERVLSARPDDHRAAAALVPIYEADEKWAGLPMLYEVLLAHATDNVTRRGFYKKLASVCGNRLQDRARAFHYAVKSFEIAPTEPGAVSELEQWARASGEWTEFARVLNARAACPDASERERRALKFTLADVESRDADRMDDAVGIYKDLISANPADSEAILALFRLLRQSPNRRDDLRWLFRLRATSAQGRARVAILAEWAKLEEEKFKSAEGAISIYREILAIEKEEPHALRALGRLLVASGDAENAASVLMRERDLASGPLRVEREVELARLSMGPLHKPIEALAAARRALEISPNDLAAIGVIEELLPVAETRAVAAVVLEQAYAAARAWDKQADVLGVLIATAPSTHDRAILQQRLADVKEKLGDRDGAFAVVAHGAEENPTDLDLWKRLAVLANRTHRMNDFVDVIARVLPERGDSGFAPTVELYLARRAATLYDDVLGEVDRAAPYLERILSCEPTNERAFSRLKQIWTARERWDDLENLYERVLSATEGAARRVELLSEVALVAEEITGNANKAIHYYERIIEIDPTHAQALLALDTLYLKQERWQSLANLLERRLALAGDNEAHSTTLKRFVDIAARQGRRSEAADVLLIAAKNASAPEPRAEILSEVAKIYEDTNDAERAEAVHRQVLDLAPDDPSIALAAARALENLYAHAPNKSRELAEVLRVQITLEESEPKRRELIVRLASICEEVLHDDTAAIAAWKMRTDDDQADEQALAALDRLYERTQDHRALAEVLRARQQQADSSESRKALMVRRAQVLGRQLNDVPQAIVAYRAVLDDFGADRATLEALALLYEKDSRWDDLADTLETELSIATREPDGAARVDILVRLGNVRAKKLGDISASIEVYREALTLNPDHASAREALEVLLDDDTVQRDVAEILKPLYEADGAAAKLLRVLDIQIAAEQSLEVRLDWLARATDILDTQLGDTARAFAYAARGLREAAGEPSMLGAWIERINRLAEKTGNAKGLVEVLCDVVNHVVDEEEQVDLYLRIADLARTKLGGAALAKEHYRHALEVRGDDARALVALEELYEEASEREEHELLIEILRRRAELEGSDAAKREILYKVAQTCAGKLGDLDRAIGVYEEILELGLDAPAIAALENLYTQRLHWRDLVALHERELHAEGTSRERRASLSHALGSVFYNSLGEIDRAFEAWSDALAEDPSHAATIASLEQLMAHSPHAGRAAEILQGVYLAELDWRKVVTAMEARLAHNQDPDERRSLLHGLAMLHEQQEGNVIAALDVTARLLHENVTEVATWSELERLAHLSNAEGRLAEIYATELEGLEGIASNHPDPPAIARLAQRTGELYEAQKSDARALIFYRRAYAFSPADEQGAFQAIDRILTRTGRAADRVALYRDALAYHDGQVEPAQRLAAISVRLELASVLSEQMNEPQAAVDELETILAETNKEPKASETDAGEAERAAVAMLETLLERAEHTQHQRVIELLRPVYERQGDWQKLVLLDTKSLSIATAPFEKVAILGQLAHLYDKRGGDLDKAFECHMQALVLDPSDDETRAELDRLGAATGRWDDLARTYEQGIATADPLLQKELLGTLAKLHDERRDDPRSAMAAWDRLFGLDESDERPLVEMDRLATLLSDWPVLVRVLSRRAELTNDDDKRAQLFRRVGEARRDMLDDEQGAIEAYERALELEPTNTLSLDNLISLYDKRHDTKNLAQVYRRRIDQCTEDDSELRHRLLLDAARCYEFDLADRREAIVLLNEALASTPSDNEIRAHLGDLYEAEKMWGELLDNLRFQADAAPDMAQKVVLRKRIGKLLARELEDYGAALEAYREVLAAGYDEEVAKATLALGEACDELRVEAANVVEPVLSRPIPGDNTTRYQLLVQALEMRLSEVRYEERLPPIDPRERVAIRKSIAEIAEKWLGDLGRAEAALASALVDAPEDESLHAEMERVASRLGKVGYARFADVLAERAAAIFDAPVASSLFFLLGKISENNLGDLDRAAKAYARAAEQGGDNDEVLSALERVHTARKGTRELADVLERRIAIEPHADLQADLYFRLACLRVDPDTDKRRMFALLRLALEHAPEHEKSRVLVEELLGEDALFEEVFATLEGVYRLTNMGEALGRLYARRVDRASGTQQRTRARLELARVLEIEGADSVSAQRAVEAAVVEDPDESDSIEELERLAEKNHAWDQASNALTRALEQHAAAPSTDIARAELWARLGHWKLDYVHDASGSEKAFRKALGNDPENITYVHALRDLTQGAGREMDHVMVLRLLVGLENEPAAKRAAAEEAARLAENVLFDTALAQATMRDLLAQNDADVWALDGLIRLFEQTGDPAEVVDLLLRRAEIEDNGPHALLLRHRAADVAASYEGGRNRAIALYEDILAQQPADSLAPNCLRVLYGEVGNYESLAKLLQMLIDNAESETERSLFRVDLASVQLEKFANSEQAASTLAAVLEENPDHDEAAYILSSIYDKAGQYADLADLQAKLVERARLHGDKDAELDRMVRLGQILDERMGDGAAALAVYDEVLEKRATHRAALEAVARLAESSKSWAKAEAALSKLVELATGSARVALALRLATARAELGHDYGVEQALRDALSEQPSNREVRSRLEELCTRTKKWASVVDLLVGDADILRDENHGFESLADSGGPPPAYVTEQVSLLRRAAEICQRELDAFETSIPLLERATALTGPAKHDHRALLLMLCDAYTATKEERAVASVLERIIASFGGKRTKELSLYHHRLGRALASLGDKDVALAQFDMAFKIDPGSVDVLRDLGMLALDNGDLERAQKTFRALLLQRLGPESGISKGEVFYYLAVIAMKQGDKAKTVQMLERAVENEPTLDRAKAMLADLKN
ncbi:MAG: tetratricopeptide repeat protein [Polyangiaceae bacterium]|nr:tetratricopeptide repeat protein [Polyangiaceae bacterium]